MTAPPCNQQSSANDYHFQNSNDELLRGLKVKKADPAEVVNAGQPQTICYAPDSPVASVKENASRKQRWKIQQRIQTQETGCDYCWNQETAGTALLQPKEKE